MPANATIAGLEEPRGKVASAIVRGAMVTERAVLDALRGVVDPETQRDVVSLGIVRDLLIEDSRVSFSLALGSQAPATKVALHSGASRAVGQIPGVSKVQI